MKKTVFLTMVGMLLCGGCISNKDSNMARYATQGGVAGAVAGGVLGNNIPLFYPESAKRMPAEFAFAGGIAGAAVGAIVGNIIDKHTAENKDKK
jgi:hypothetical protein